MATATTATRWERVREILERAHPEEPVYTGAGRFWRDLDTLLAAEIAGVRMVAPAQPAAGRGCGCGTPGCGGGAAEGEAKFPGRGDASGLVRGLRGHPPFDGSRLPRLPWGGPRVEEEEIRFIARWIDDGTPAADHEGGGTAAFEVRGKNERLPVVVVDPRIAADLTRAAGGGAEGRYGGELRQRMNLDCLTPDQLAQLRYAFRELYALNKWPRDRRSYNNLALIHQDHCQHGWERFLPWHRAYLYEFEQAMQDVCPGVTMPYWDWTMPWYRPAQPYKGEIIPRSFKAFLTDATLAAAAAKDPAVKKHAGELRKRFVETGRLFTSPTRFFEAAKEISPELAEGDASLRLMDALLDGNPLWYPLRFPAEYYDSKGKPQTINENIHYHYPTAEDMEAIMRLRTFRDFGGGSLYNDSFGFIDQNPHNTMHIWTGGQNPFYTPPKNAQARLQSDSYRERNRSVSVTGRAFHTRQEFYEFRSAPYGDMFSNLTAAYDPIFWPIHANIDRCWWEWQQMNPHALPADLTAVLTPWGYTTADMLDISRFGYEYVRCAFVVPVGMEAPVGRFVSKEIPIPDGVRAGFRTAEVRLHRVPQLPRSCFIRVFLNLPDADAHTPPEGNHFAGYLAVFGHGACYGGPGHCDVPPAQGRPFDLRPRSHNTPRNHRIDVTRAARALLDAGATSLRVTLVTIGVDYEEEPELLRLDGLSLNFLD
jgi:tyrosinase